MSKTSIRTVMLTVLALAIAAFLGGCPGDTVQPPAAVAPPGDDAAAKTSHGVYGVDIIPPTATPYGLSYAEWSARWWQWLWSAPADRNPGLDATGEFVDWAQTGPVWFLAPAYYGQWERTATIPNGTMIFIDLAGFCVSLSMGDGTNEAELRAVATAYVDALISDVILEVDGQRLERVEDFRFATPPGLFDIVLPENNMFEFFGYDIPAGTYPDDGVAEGYYAMLPPLSVGRHTILLSADFADPYNETIQVLYHLTVAPGKADRRRGN